MYQEHNPDTVSSSSSVGPATLVLPDRLSCRWVLRLFRLSVISPLCHVFPPFFHPPALPFLLFPPQPVEPPSLSLGDPFPPPALPMKYLLLTSAAKSSSSSRGTDPMQRSESHSRRDDIFSRAEAATTRLKTKACVCFIKLQITRQPGPEILIFQCYTYICVFTKPLITAQPDPGILLFQYYTPLWIQPMEDRWLQPSR